MGRVFPDAALEADERLQRQRQVEGGVGVEEDAGPSVEAQAGLDLAAGRVPGHGVRVAARLRFVVAQRGKEVQAARRQRHAAVDAQRVAAARRSVPR